MQCSVRSMTEAKPISDTLPKKGKVTEVCKEWLVHEDGALAYALQQQEVERHYHNNKAKNALLREDVPFAVNEQKREYQEALIRHNQHVVQQEERDAAVAKRLADEYATQEEIRRARLERDSVLAQQLQERIKVDPAGDVNTVGLPLPGPRPPAAFRDPAVRPDEEAVRVERHREEWALRRNERITQIPLKDSSSGRLFPPGPNTPSSARLASLFPSTSGMHPPSTSGVHSPPPSGMHAPSTSAMHSPSTSGMHSPSTSGMHSPSPPLVGAKTPSPPRGGIPPSGMNLPNPSRSGPANPSNPPSPSRMVSGNSMNSSSPPRMTNMNAMNPSSSNPSRIVNANSMNHPMSGPPRSSSSRANGLPRDVEAASLAAQNLLPLPARGVRRLLWQGQRPPGCDADVPFSSPVSSVSPSGAVALCETAAACPVVEACGRTRSLLDAMECGPGSSGSLKDALGGHSGPVHCTQPLVKKQVAGDIAVAGPSSREDEDAISPWPPPPSTQELDKHQQEIQDEELARQLQEVLSAEDDQESRDRAVAIEAQDLEIARMLQDKERAKVRRARERAKAKAAARRETEASGTPSLAEEPVQEGVVPAPGGIASGVTPSRGLSPGGSSSRSSSTSGLVASGGVTPSTSGGLVPGAGGSLVPNIAAAIDPTFSRPARSPSSGVDLIRASPHTTPPSHAPSYDEEDTTIPYFPVQGQKRTSSLDKKKKNRPKDSGCKQQ